MRRTVRFFITFALCSCLCSNVCAEETIGIQHVQQWRAKQGKADKYMSAQEFDVLYRKVKEKAFKEQQMELIEIGSLDSRFACHQCRRIMEIFKFDDDKLRVLNIMAPHTVDKKNVPMLIDALTFENNKNKAVEILKRR